MMSRAAFLLATILLAGCTSDEFIGDQSLADANGQTPITFSSGVPAVTRTDKSGADAADDLGNQFIVWGEKGTDEVATAPVDGNLVFPNYTVNYAASTAYTTTSNTKGWEYVGYKYGSGGTTTEFNYQDNITTKNGNADAVKASDAVQTIKYWDYGAAKYVFPAVSADKGDLAAGRVKIQKNTSGTTVYDKGYTITLDKDASNVYPSLDKLYFADRKVISSSNNTDRTQTDTYGGNVTFRFRNLVSQVRAGVYETIPGYAISEIKFYVNNNEATPAQTAEAKDGDDQAFGAVCPNIKATNYEGALTVTYYDNTVADTENQPKITADDTTPATNLILGTNMSTINTSSLLGTTATAPTWDTNGGTFTKVLPQIGNSTNLKLKADYKLYNDITKEVIEVKGATAEIPAKYLQWKPNYKYTYLFKISDNTNGSTGQSVTGLYPITFDAVEVVAEDGQAEYITTVSEPSITTFGVKDGKYSAGKAEYEEGSDIYATFMEGSEVKELNLGTNVNVYKATTTDATNFPITEASVAEAIAETSSGTKKITVTNINSDASANFTAAPAKVTTVPGEDGVNKDINALKLTGVKAGTYAIEYEASTAWTGDYKKVYKVIHVAAPVTPTP